MEVSSSTPSASSMSVPETRLSKLVNRMNTNYISLPEELCAASRPSSPSSDERIAEWKSQVSYALRVAGGDTTHPKWGHVSRITQLACTSRRYIGVAPGVRMGDGRPVTLDKKFEWALPETEERWKRYEKKWEMAVQGVKSTTKAKTSPAAAKTSKYWPKRAPEQQAASSSRHPPSPSKAEVVRKKVEKWQAEVVTEAEDVQAVYETVNPQGDKGKGKAKSTHPPGEKVQTSLGFRVVKRSSVTDAKGGRSAASKPKPPSPARSPHRPDPDTESTHATKAAEPPNHCGGDGDVPMLSQDHNDLPLITEVPELSFLPPSFPSQLKTSTPPLNYRRHKPAPIVPCSPPPSSPQSPYSSGSFDPSHPQPRIPLPESSNPPAVSPVPRPPKRARTPDSSGEDGMDVSPQSPRSKAPPSKRARADPFLEQEPISSGPQPVPPSTPPLSTSPAKAPVTPVSRGKGLGNAKGLPVPTTPDRQPLPTLTELLASSRRSKPRPRPPSRKHTPQSQAGGSTNKAGHARRQVEVETELTGVAEDSEPEPSPTKTYFSSPASGSSDSASIVHRSPVSPLFTQNPGAFVPAFVSSQRPSANDDDPFVGVRSQGPSQGQGLMRGSSGFFGMGYNSQFDVEGQVDRVSELLERDVDYNGWLRDLDEVDEEDMPATQSQGTVGVGY
ncbi:hypothetical protein GY45DRAFT_1359810 [Cubamyces sp. BRFM 1775]|nr:hypothetical protein GY45DRAFT_1359810 [Cubamyces sp. BRFM 1775]